MTADTTERRMPDDPGRTSGGGPSADDSLEAFDRIVESVGRWARRLELWPPARRIAAEWEGVEPRVASLRGELARVLVVGVLGGTGTGKSTLVNAIAGGDVSPAGDVARPTTKAPVVVAGPGVDCSWLPIDRFKGRLVRSPAPAVAEIVLIDCPDPDTQPLDGEGAREGDGARPSDANRNRDALEEVLPECDVLLVVSTAQKYRSWSVVREVLAFAPGRPVLFVQTHASLDVDIRDDWRRELERQGFDVPRIHRVDGVEAVRRAADGLPAEEGFAELVAAIERELAGRAARRVRTTGAGDLMDWFFRQAAAAVEGVRKPVAELGEAVARERTRLGGVLAATVEKELRDASRAWQRLLIGDIIDTRTGGPFAAFLRAVAALTAWLPRGTSAGRGVVGRLLATRLAGPMASVQSPRFEGQPAEPIERGAPDAVVDLGLAASEVEQSRSILVGLAARARLAEPLVGRARLVPERAEEVSGEVLSRIRRWLSRGVDGIVAARRGRGSTELLAMACELLFGGLVAAVLGRAGWSFFHDRLWKGLPGDTGSLLWESLFWVAVCGFLLRWLLVAVERRGLDRDVAALVARLPEAGCVEPVLADFSEAAAEASAFIADGDRLAAESAKLTAGMAAPSAGLGRLRRSVSGTLGA